MGLDVVAWCCSGDERRKSVGEGGKLTKRKEVVQGGEDASDHVTDYFVQVKEGEGRAGGLLMEVKVLFRLVYSISWVGRIPGIAR